MMFIFANSFSEAENWARGYDIKRHTWSYVDRASNVRGYSHCAILILPGCELSQGQIEALDYLRQMKAVLG
jgi:hypothetical protein